ncbi:MAG: site-2 protease family protein [Acidobacteriota bacterium]
MPEAQQVESGAPKKKRVVLPVAFLFLAILSTLLAGFLFDTQFSADSPEQAWQLIRELPASPLGVLRGAPFSLTLLLILLAHEMGHYLGCRYYGIDATLPYVIPAPPLLPVPPPLSWVLGVGWIPFNPFGTFGAVIRIRSPFGNRRQLFDVGIAGPLAGFVFIVPALILGVLWSKEFVLLNPQEATLEYGEPLLFRLAVMLFYGAGNGSNISLHPIGWAAWFGMLATSINLLPIGQLDGGHVTYALFGPRLHRLISVTTFLGLVALSFLSWPALGYLFFAVLLIFLGFRHPRPYAEFEGPGRGRRIVAVIGLIVFALTFIPIPIKIVEHIVRL